jgi:hypothetical protein
LDLSASVGAIGNASMLSTPRPQPARPVLAPSWPSAALLSSAVGAARLWGGELQHIRLSWPLRAGLPACETQRCGCPP